MIHREIIPGALNTDIELIVEDDGQVTIQQSSHAILVENPTTLANALINAIHRHEGRIPPDYTLQRPIRTPRQCGVCGLRIHEAHICIREESP